MVMVLHLLDNPFFPSPFLSLPKSNYISHQQKQKTNRKEKKKKKYNISNLAPQKKVNCKIYLPNLPYLPTYILSFRYEMRPCLFPKIWKVASFTYTYLPTYLGRYTSRHVYISSAARIPPYPRLNIDRIQQTKRKRKETPQIERRTSAFSAVPPIPSQISNRTTRKEKRYIHFTK